MIPTRRTSLLVVLTHPDNEIFLGDVLAHLSDRGVRVTRHFAVGRSAGF
jgi:LmbE family N-acetylglucosaminyl deacetylase